MTHYVKILKELGLPSDLDERLEAFARLFLRWNERINLSAARTIDQISEHVIDSLHVLPCLGDSRRAIDVGAGGGFPSLVIGLCCPDLSLVALEPIHKKHAFLRTAVRELGLSNVTALARRVEDHDERDYDVAFSRATFDLREWLERGLSLVRVGGRVLGFEGVRRDDLPAELERFPYTIEGKQRAIVSVQRRL